MPVRCRFKVESIINHADNTATVEMRQVADSPADVERAGAQLLLHRIAPETSSQLAAGAEYFIDITPIPAPAPTSTPE